MHRKGFAKTYSPNVVEGAGFADPLSPHTVHLAFNEDK